MQVTFRSLRAAGAEFTMDVGSYLPPFNYRNTVWTNETLALDLAGFVCDRFESTFGLTLAINGEPFISGEEVWAISVKSGTGLVYQIIWKPPVRAS